MDSGLGSCVVARTNRAEALVAVSLPLFAMMRHRRQVAGIASDRVCSSVRPSMTEVVAPVFARVEDLPFAANSMTR